MAALADRLTGIVEPAKVLRPELDESFSLTPKGSRRVAPTEPPRLRPEQVGRLDWHNEVSRLLLEISEALRARPDEKSRRVLIRRLQRALRAKEAGRG
jgi:metallo-beta-lactamase family protein